MHSFFGSSTVDYFDVDQWDGVPQERARLLGELRARTSDRTVVVSVLTSTLDEGSRPEFEPAA